MGFNPVTGIYENDEPSYFPHTGGLAGVDILNPFRAQQLAAQAQEGRDIAMHLQALQAEKSQKEYDDLMAFQQGLKPDMAPEDVNMLAMQTNQLHSINPFIGLQKSQNSANARVEAAGVTGASRENVANIHGETARDVQYMKGDVAKTLAEGKGLLGEGGEGIGPAAEAKIGELNAQAEHLRSLTETATELRSGKSQLLAAQASSANALAEYRRAEAALANVRAQGGKVTAKQAADMMKAAGDLKAKVNMELAKIPALRGSRNPQANEIANRIELGVKKMNEVVMFLEEGAKMAAANAQAPQAPASQPPATPAPGQSNSMLTVPLEGGITQGPQAQ